MSDPVQYRICRHCKNACKAESNGWRHPAVHFGSCALSGYLIGEIDTDGPWDMAKHGNPPRDRYPEILANERAAIEREQAEADRARAPYPGMESSPPVVSVLGIPRAADALDRIADAIGFFLKMEAGGVKLGRHPMTPIEPVDVDLIDSLRDLLKASNAHSDMVEREAADLREQLKDAKSSRIAIKKRNQWLEDENSDLQGRVKELEADNARQAAMITDLSQGISELTAANAAQRAEFDNVNTILGGCDRCLAFDKIVKDWAKSQTELPIGPPWSPIKEADK